MGQIGQILGYTLGFKNAPYPVEVSPGTNQPGLEAIPLTDLAANPITGMVEHACIRPGPKQRRHPPAVFIFCRRIGCQALQCRHNPLAGPFHSLAVNFPGTRMIGGFKVDHIINDIQVNAVVNDGLGR